MNTPLSERQPSKLAASRPLPDRYPCSDRLLGVSLKKSSGGHCEAILQNAWRSEFIEKVTMRRRSTNAALPAIEIIRKGSVWEVHWDYQEAPESSILFRRREYLDGYIDGVMDEIGIRPEKVSCASGRTGSVKRLAEEEAIRLRDALHRLLVPIVSNEFNRLKSLGEIPSVD